MDDKTVVESLIESCSRQLAHYRELDAVTQKVLSRVVLSRGDVSGVTGGLDRKQKILEEITAERTVSQDAAMQWQARKGAIPPGPRTDVLNTILDDMQRAITAVLEKEDQLRKYFERAIRASGRPEGSSNS